MQRRSRDSARARASSAGSDSTSSGCTANAGRMKPDTMQTSATNRAVIAGAMRNLAIISATRMRLLGRLQNGAALRPLRRADAPAPVRQPEAAGHDPHEGAEPDEQHQRLVIELHR